MINLPTFGEKYIEEKQIPSVAERFVRKEGSYKIADIVGKARDHVETVGQGQKKVVISGAGPAGLATALILAKKGFYVVVVEKREEFSRTNLINLNCEVQAYLREHDLLKEFERSVAARIKNHRIVVVGKEGTRLLQTSDVSKLQFKGPLSKDPKKFKDLFKEDGIYSVQIKDLQAFLAQKAAHLGVRILSESELKIVTPIEKGRVTKIEIAQKNSSSFLLTIEPDLFFIAEGSHSTSARQLGMVDDSKDVVNNACTGENWIIGNLKYHGKKTFVLSMVITSKKTLQIANVIFNAKSRIVNVAVTTDDKPSEDDIERLILATAQKAFKQVGITEALEIVETIKQPVSIENRIASVCSRGNVFRIGDAVGNSSPLAGSGGTGCLTLLPIAVEQLLEDYKNGSDNLHSNFKTYSQAYVKRWIDKSELIKKNLQEIFEKDKALELESKDSTQKKGVGDAT